jgi:4-azaleucine resistance transporter AzlC
MEKSETTPPLVMRLSVLRGITRALPIVMGYVPIGFAYGVLAKQAGLSTFNAVAMSVLVYAGSAQLIGAGLFAVGAPALSIVVTTFVVNLRHMLFSAALSPYLKGWRPGALAAFAYELTDETFAVHSVQFPEGVPPKTEVFALNITSQLSWLAGGWLGAVVGGLINDVTPFALDYTLPAMFIALLVIQIRARLEFVIAVFAGLLSVLLTLLGVGRWSVILATIVGATLGVVLETLTGQRWSESPRRSESPLGGDLV